MCMCMKYTTSNNEIEFGTSEFRILNIIFEPNSNIYNFECPNYGPNSDLPIFKFLNLILKSVIIWYFSYLQTPTSK